MAKTVKATLSSEQTFFSTRDRSLKMYVPILYSVAMGISWACHMSGEPPIETVFTAIFFASISFFASDKKLFIF